MSTTILYYVTGLLFILCGVTSVLAIIMSPWWFVLAGLFWVLLITHVMIINVTSVWLRTVLNKRVTYFHSIYICYNIEAQREADKYLNFYKSKNQSWFWKWYLDDYILNLEPLKSII